MDFFVALAMTLMCDKQQALTGTKTDNPQTKRNHLTSRAYRERILRLTPPHCRRNSNLPTSMSGRASVQFLPAWMSYS
jgi:hypothetical protein